METTTSESSTIQYVNIPDQTDQTVTAVFTSKTQPLFQREQRYCFGECSPGECFLAVNPHIVLLLLTGCNLDPRDLARLEVTCSFFKVQANFSPDTELSITELAALVMCKQKVIFKPMTVEERCELKTRCGGSWKLALRFLLAGEACTRRETSHAVAGPGHSIVVTAKGDVYSFGSNSFGQLGHVDVKEESRPRLIRSLQGIRIIQAAVGPLSTVLISDTGHVYTFGKGPFGEAENGVAVSNEQSMTPKIVESLKKIFVVQVVIGHFFAAVLSREGAVYTISWGADGVLGHDTQRNDFEPRPLLGALENVPVVQIAAGFCYLLALACQPSGMSVYSVGCGQGGKLGHDTTANEEHPRRIEHFQTLNFQPTAIAAGAWHSVVMGQDGRVFTWGWNRHGCLGRYSEECETTPKVVEALSHVKAVYVAAGEYTSFVVSDDGLVYSFGNPNSSCLGYPIPDQPNGHLPKLVQVLKEMNERVVQISVSNFKGWEAHSFALTESGKLYAFGYGRNGQLGIQPASGQVVWVTPKQVEIDLN